MRALVLRSLRLVTCLAMVVGFCALATSASWSQGLGMGNDRAHPEFDWQEFETEHFILVYPKHLQRIALRAASIAEQVYEPITKGFATEMPRRTSMVITDEDQIVNGYALPGKIFLWVNQNDFAHFFSGDEKWLRKVIAHEFQHTVWFEASRNWMGLFGLLGGAPAWYVEGVAEYMTEVWGPYRSDLDVRSSILRNRHQSLDPHDSGFSMVRYMADQYGDSTLVRAVKERHWGLPAFSRGFQKSAGVSLGDFEEEWRRVATAYTYASFSQKERVTDVGEAVRSPSHQLTRIAYSPAGSLMAVLNRGGAGRLPTLVTITNDSLKQTREIDHGEINGNFAFDGDATHLVYAKRHRSTHGSFLWDLKVADLKSGSARWITTGRRANHPHWSPVAERIVYIAIDSSTTNLYTCDGDGRDVRRLTAFADDVQILAPRFSADGKQVAFSLFEKDRSIDLAVLDVASGEYRYITESAAYDLNPMWSADGSRLFFTSDRNNDGIPNLYTLPANGTESAVECMTDVGEALYGMDYDRSTERVLARSMTTTDSVRLRSIDPARRVTPVDPVIDPRLTSWRTKEPLNPVPAIASSALPERSATRSYNGWRHMRPFQRFVLPSPAPWGVIAAGLFSDIAHRHTLAFGFDVGTRHDHVQLRGVYGNYETNMLPFGISGSLALSGSYGARFGFLLYGEELLFNRQSHGQVVWRLPLNRGEHDYAIHNIELRALFSAVEVQDRDDLDASKIRSRGLPEPSLDYRDNRLGCRYRYHSSRPHARLFGHAMAGQGFWVDAQWADKAFGSTVEFRRITLDASKAMPTPVIPIPLFLRGRFESTWGTPASQDFTGLRADVPIWPMHYSTNHSFSDIVDLKETFFVRGLPMNVVGEQALVTTLEWRLPLLPPLPINAFTLNIDGLTGVLFYDHGRVWGIPDQALTGVITNTTLARHTVGWELRLPLRFSRQTLFTASYGEGQMLSWEADGAQKLREEYFRLAMLQPF